MISFFLVSPSQPNQLLLSHTVVTTVRSQDKVDRIKAMYPNLGREQLDFEIVPDISREGSFHAAVQSYPPYDAVIHTASPLNFSIGDVQKDVLDPAIIGTTSLLFSVMRFAPKVKRVIVLSSFAAMSNLEKGNWPEHTYTAADWNPITHTEALRDNILGYRGSKTFSERAAWEFMDREKPGFTLTTLNPPFVFGPVVQYPGLSLGTLNTSNGRFLSFLKGIASPNRFLRVDKCQRLCFSPCAGYRRGHYGWKENFSYVIGAVLQSRHPANHR